MKKIYLHPSACVVKLALHDATNQDIPIFGEGSQGGGPGIADGKENEFEEDEERTENFLKYINRKQWLTLKDDEEDI